MYMQKNEIFLNFVSEMRGFESKEREEWENYRDDKSIIAIIVLGVREPFLGNQKSGSRLLEQPDV